ncbi:MAG: SMP-30/gluconolactonase/LRE family protein [Saprospiraceae bacterium]
MKKYFFLINLLIVCGCLLSQSNRSLGKIHIIDPSANALLDTTSIIEVLADGFDWSEGPLWWNEEKALLFSDVPQNTVFIWRDNGEGTKPYVKPSGFTGVGKYSGEPGSNGLARDLKGNLISCEHGDRRISSMPLNKPGGKMTITDNFYGKRFNSPNDAIVDSKGRIYFTDPPYGLPLQEKDKFETGVFGVYLFEKGKTTLIIKDLTRPNGLTLSPDEKTLYVAQSDPDKAYYMKYPVLATGLVGKGSLLFDATPMKNAGYIGLPDGIKMDHLGNIWGTGPGGILIISPKGILLARIETGQATANCGWGEDGSTLFITADMYLCRLKTKVKGTPFR